MDTRTEHFAERLWLEVHTTLDRQANRLLRALKLREHEVAPLPLETDDVAEESKVIAVLLTVEGGKG